MEQIIYCKKEKYLKENFQKARITQTERERERERERDRAKITTVHFYSQNNGHYRVVFFQISTVIFRLKILC